LKLFDAFKDNIPDNSILCSNAANIVLSGYNEDEIKKNFSILVSKMQDEIYYQYLIAQKSSGQKVLDDVISKTGGIDFENLDSFFMSIFQSRKSRAGKAFEYIIREMFSRLSYPFAEQVNVNGATPDFIMPSEEYFRKRPLDSIIFTAKRTLRERWRQVVTEANQGYSFFLATIDTKIAPNQLKQAADHKIYIVVPESIKTENSNYNDAYNVLSFEEFFEHHLDPALKRWKL
jgi:hypothetical protein